MTNQEARAQVIREWNARDQRRNRYTNLSEATVARKVRALLKAKVTK